MKKFLFLLILFFTFPVFAKDVTNYIQYDTDNPTGTYKADEISLGGYNGKFDVKTRYNGRLSMIEFVLSSDYYDFSPNTIYTITLNMATNDWRNNFMGPQVIKLNSNGSQQTTNGSLSVSNFQFVSRKTIKFNFKTNSSISPYLLFRLYSTDYASNNTTAITGDSNWNLNSIVITNSSSGSSSSGSSSSGSSSNGGASTTNSTISCSNGLVVSSRTFGSSDVNINSYYLNSSANQVSDTSYGIVTYVPITQHTTYYINKSNNTDVTPGYCLYTSQSSATSCSSYNSRNSISFDSGSANYISLSLRYGQTITLTSCVSPLDIDNQNTQDIINNNNDNTTNIINNNNDNTQQLIDNQNQNTQDIIDNQNQNAQNTQNAINDSFGNECRASHNLITHDDISYSRQSGNISVSYSKGFFDINGTSSSGGFIIGYNNNTNTLAFSIGHYTPGTYYVEFAKENGSITYQSGASQNSGFYFRVGSTSDLLLTATINKNTNYYANTITISEETDLFISWYIPSSGWVFDNYRLSFQIVRGTESLNFEQPGQICKNKLDDTKTAIDNVNNSINNDSVDDKSSFFSGFNSDDHGLSSIITIPLNTIQQLTNSSCVPLSVPIPFTNSNVSLPCMTQVYETHIPSVYNLWKIVSFGIIAYFICLDIFRMVKGFKDPQEDKVEVLDL